MKKILLLIFSISLFAFTAGAQLLSVAPEFPKDNDNIIITMDATKGNLGLNNYSPVSDVYVHTGVITSLSTSNTDWRYSKFTWATTPVAAQATSLGGNKWQYTITNIRSFYAVPAGETILKIAILFRNGAGTSVQRNADASDMFIPVYDNTIATKFTVPFFQPTFTRIPEPISKSVGDNIALTAVANISSTMKLFLNGTEIQTASAITTISANPTITTAGTQTIRVDAIDGATTKSESFSFFVGSAVNVAPLPAGVKDGINYEAGNTSVVLVLYAPGKNRVSVIGDFPGSNWIEQNNYVMNKTPDGNYWWLRITGLTSGTEYSFQYLVDGTLKVGEPYAEKVLDPWNDGYISATTYPGLKAYPTGLTTGIVSILQTNAPAYNWAVNNFSRPDKRNLVIYELLLRDFVLAHDWKTLKDTLSYLKTLGVNAIEIMPFNEFDGNESWGYNPSYFLAPDKYYGTKNSLKEFIDTCHKNGIAVLMDIALNHTTGDNPLAALYWNSGTNQPAANNPWLNVTATHPFSVFNDFNHESLQTRYFSSRVMAHWLQEYKIDGYRFDLSKGFTQFNSGSNAGLMAQYDASRIAIWKRYYDTCQLKAPGSIVILEHFADNSEEKELSNYGMMIWGNAAYNFEQASMGFTTGSNFDYILHTTRTWNNPYVVGYMESHDEERMMYKNLQSGNVSGSYNIKDLNTGLKRIELCGSFFLASPGPKMIWQFGELGYHYSINTCTDGTVNNNCRLSNKPIRWDFKDSAQRKQVYNVFSKMNKLRFHGWYKDVFTANNITLEKDFAPTLKWLKIRSATDSSMLLVVGNFDVNAQPISVTFPTAGTWFDYLNNTTFSATGTAQSIPLQPGEYRVFINRNVNNTVITAVGNNPTISNLLSAKVFSNPLSAASVLSVNMKETDQVQIDFLNLSGQKIAEIANRKLAKGTHTISLGALYTNPKGVYIIRVQTAKGSVFCKLAIQ